MGGMGRIRSRNRRGTFPRGIAAALACLAALALSGCFVKPNPISEAEHWQRAQEDKRDVFAGQELPTGPISLPEAIARAVKYNLDHRLSQMEAAFHLQELEVANLNMLPRLAVNAGYSLRSNESASTSIGYYTRTESLIPSFSTAPSRGSGDLSFSWSALDFGLSYFQARQQADRHLILLERRRRIMNNLVKDVIATYFRVATAERVGPLVRDTLKRAEDSLEVYRKIEESKKAPRAQTLAQQSALINTVSHLRLISVELAAARSRLAALMNLPLDADFAIVVPGDADLSPPNLSASLAELETIGVYLRPDLREESYQARIDKYEVKKEMLRMVPGMSVLSNLNYDDNKYLVHQHWSELGLKASLDIIGLAGKYKQVKASKTQVEVTRTRRLAGTIAAMVQIDLGYYQYKQAIELYRDSEKLNAIENKLLDLASASTKAREVGVLDHIRQSAMAVNSRLDRDRNLVEVLSAWGNLYFSVGGDILGGVQGDEELGQLTALTAAALDRWLAGGLPPLPEGAADAPILPGGCIATAVAADAALASVPAPAPESAPAVSVENWSGAFPAEAVVKVVRSAPPEAVHGKLLEELIP